MSLSYRQERRRPGVSEDVKVDATDTCGALRGVRHVIAGVCIRHLRSFLALHTP